MLKKKSSFRFQSDYKCLSDFSSTVLLVCPRCKKCAELIPLQGDPRDAKGIRLRQVVCKYCAYFKEFSSSTFDMACYSAAWPQRLPLWLQAPCCGKVLWAFNGEHLSYLEQFVAAGHRERAGDGKNSNHSMTSRLPQWMQSAKHRAEVLRGIERLRRRLPSSAGIAERKTGSGLAPVSN